MAVLDPAPIVAALRGAFTREESRETMLRIAAEKVRAAGASDACSEGRCFWS